jgi:hypothetical protein
MGLIVRLEHSNTYLLTDDGQRFAIFYTKIHNRLLRHLLAAEQPPAALDSGRPSRSRRHRLHRPSGNRRLKLGSNLKPLATKDR